MLSEAKHLLFSPMKQKSRPFALLRVTIQDSGFFSSLLDVHVVMPNHFHGLIVLGDREDVGTEAAVSSGRARPGRAATTERFGKPVAASLPTIIRSFKAASTRRVNLSRGIESVSIWQRNYYEHIIRNDDVLLRAREYIQNNPLSWALDPENTERQQP